MGQRKDRLNSQEADMNLLRAALCVAIGLCGLVIAPSSLAAADVCEMTGIVTLDGQPLPSGKITLHRANGQFVGSKIKDGKYAIDLAPAEMLRVTFEGDGVPVKYASEDKTSLVVMLVKGNKAAMNFDLKK
jgi:hypothetical protein